MKKKTPAAVRGTQDIYGIDAEAFAFVVETFDRIRRLYRFGRLEMPAIEKTEVFSRAIGETTDVVSKEMYSFEDRGGHSVTLRPEFTAGIARAFLTNGWQQHAPMKLATHGPLFRYERPQKGRYRQFHQIDTEIIGAAEPHADVELLVMADQIIRELQIEGVSLHLNTLGDAESRNAWRGALVKYFMGVKGDLSLDSQARLERNPLRILDSKDRQDQILIAEAPKIDSFLSDEASRFFEDVTSGLKASGVKWVRSQSLVRGLDYYRHTAFEFIPDKGGEAASRLGSQSTLLGGGRYDGLIESLGGSPIPAVGWAAGIERLALLIGSSNLHNHHCDVAVIPAGPNVEGEVQRILSTLRKQNISCEFAFTGNMKKRLQKASAAGAAFAVIVGDAELAKGEITIKDMVNGEQFPLSLDVLSQAISKMLLEKRIVQDRNEGVDPNL